MRGRSLALWLLLVATVPAVRAQELGDSAICARCHGEEAALAAVAGGHAPLLDCAVCHEDRRPGRFGHGHRTIPTSCTSHHQVSVETHPTPDKELRPKRLRRKCLTCHDPHGSPNAHLIRPFIRTRGRLRPIAFPESAGSPPFVDSDRPGRGLCEVCHRDTRFYPASGHGESHFTGDCTVCHDHMAGFRPVVSDASCATCHPNETAKLAKDNLHHDEFTGRCSSCHAEASPDPGPGHRLTSACADCHSPSRVTTHAPGIGIPCTQCHDPHGSDNIRLVRDVVRTTIGTDQPIRFTALTGRADGSFASASTPGTGLCEVCHTRTRFYRADATGSAHYTTSCIQCHPHEAGFFPH